MLKALKAVKEGLICTEKRGGAWMDEVVGQSRLLAPAGESVRLPVGHMVCNQTPPVGDKPSLMTFRVSTVACGVITTQHPHDVPAKYGLIVPRCSFYKVYQSLQLVRDEALEKSIRS